jgi:hypothetical protein
MPASAPHSGSLPERDQLLNGKPPPARLPRGDALTNATFVLLFLLSLALLGWGIYLAARQNNWNILPAGVIATILVLVTWPIARNMATTAGAHRMLAERIEDELRPLRQAVENTARTLRAVEQNTLISERAKRVAYREREREVVRRAIEEDLMAGDFAGARTLINEMEKSFGYTAEAERFRDQIKNRLAGEREREIESARSEIDRLMIDERWNDAFAAAERLVQKYGGDMEIRLLRTRIEERRQKRKAQLVDQFHSARSRDPDEALDLLRRLDTYLTPEEGQQLADSAKEVFRGRLRRLRDQFTHAMHQHDFLDALRIGEMIKNEFPNSKLSQEVREHEPKLREAAGVEPEEASA